MSNNKKKLWIVGASSFGLDIGMRYRHQQNDEWMTFISGFLDNRKNIITDAQRILNKHKKFINLKCNHIAEHNFDEKDCVYLFGTSDGNFKKNIFNQYIKQLDLLGQYIIMRNIDPNVHANKNIIWNSFIASQVTLGYANFFDRGCVVGHNVNIGDFNHFGVNVIIGGNSTIGDCSIIHSGAVIGNNISIGDNCEIGAGAVVLRSLESGSKIIAPKSIKLN